MPQSTECFPKSKVRFSHVSDTVGNENNVETEKNIKRDLPKIRSIVSVKNPVKVISFNAKQDAVNPTLESNKDKENSILKCDSNKHEPLNDATNAENIKANSELDKNVCESKISITVPPLALPSTLNHQNYDKASGATESTSKGTSKPCTQNCTKKGKENKLFTMKKPISGTYMDKNMKPNTLKISSFSKSTCPNENNSKRSTVVKFDKKNMKTHALLDSTKEEKKSTNICTSNKVGQKNRNTKPTSINLMPCYKHKKTTPRNKSSEVKKSVVRDVVCNNKNIDSGVLKQKSTIECDVNNKNKNVHIKSCVTSAEDLSKPKYNSIMCTVNKLNEVKKEKIVTDIDHLPMNYKSLVNGKISSALDFPLNEAIYKNLVDLSIDDAQLPSRITRSKDPEPRQKDIVPQLSDFFNPEYEEEYCIPMHIKPKNPEIAEHWNAFRISDKISEWKSKMDCG